MGLGNNFGFGSKTGGGGGSDSFDGNRPISLPGIPNLTGKILGGSTVKQFLEGFFPATAPGAAMTASNPVRLLGAPTDVILSYTATKNTNPITNITVDGQSIVPTGNTQSGTQNATAVQNIDTTFNMAVTAGSQTTLASATVAFRNYRWWFLSSTDLYTLTDAQISTFLNALPVGTFEFATDKNQPQRTFNPASQYIYFGHLSSYGVPTFIVNNLPNTAFQFKDFIYTNPFGYTVSLKLSRSNNLLTGNYNVDIN